MICPRCSNEWAGSQGICPRCGLNVRGSTPLEARLPDAVQQPTTQPGDLFYVQQEPFPARATQTDDFPWPNTPVPGLPGTRSASGRLAANDAAQGLPGTRPMSGGLAGNSPAAQGLPGTRPMSGGLAGPESLPGSGNLHAGGSLSGKLSGSGPLEQRQPGAHASASNFPSADASWSAYAASSPGGFARTDPLAGPAAGAAYIVPSATRPLVPGALLRDGRYRLQDLLERQDWLPGVFEAAWIGRDTRRGELPVMICEVVVPDLASLIKQSDLQNASRALAATGRDSRIAALLEAFSDQGRSFFVFEHIDGENLLTHLRRSGHPLAEAEVIELCWQMCEVLDLLSHQHPPLVHGQIRPEHIYLGRTNQQFILGNFSPLIVIGATQFIRGVEPRHLSPYSPPEFPGDMINVRSDLYSLLATAYHAVTGSTPSSTNTVIPRARQLNPAISFKLDTILTKGLHPAAQQRYQSPAELRQDLLALRASEDRKARSRSISAELGRELNPAQADSLASLGETPTPAPFAFPIQITPLASELELKQAVALPQPETLPPLREGQQYLAAIEAAVVILGLIAVTVFSNYHI